MPKIKVSQMSVATTLNATDTMMIIQDGVNKKSSVTNLLKNLNSSDSIRVNQIQSIIDVTISSKNDTNMFVVKGGTDRLGVGTNSPESKLHVNGNLQVGSATTDGVVVRSTESITYTTTDQTDIVTKVISPLRATTVIICNTGVNGLFSLSNGFNGAIKTVSVNALDGGKSAIISLTGAGFNRVTLNLNNQTVTLQYISSIAKWVVIGSYGAVAFSTV